MNTWVKINESVTDYVQHQTETAENGATSYTVTGDDFNYTPDLAGSYVNPITGQTVSLSNVDTGDGGNYPLPFGQVFDVETVNNSVSTPTSDVRSVDDHKFAITGSADGTTVQSDTKPPDGDFIQEPNKPLPGTDTITDSSGNTRVLPVNVNHAGIAYHSYVWVDAGPTSSSPNPPTPTPPGRKKNGLTTAETQFLSDLETAGALDGSHPYQDLQNFIQGDRAGFEAAAGDFAHRRSIASVASDAVQAGVGPGEFLKGVVGIGIGTSAALNAGALASALIEGTGLLLTAGTVGIELAGAALAIGGFCAAYDAVTGEDTLGRFEANAKSKIHAYIKDGG